MAVFDYDELDQDDNMLVLCVRRDETQEFRAEHACYVWTGPLFSLDLFPESETLDESGFV